MNVSLMEVLGAVFGIIKGIVSIAASFWAGMALILTVFGRVAGTHFKDRYWRKVNNALASALMLIIFGVIGCILGNSYVDLLGFSTATAAGILLLASAAVFLTFLLIPRKPKPAPGQAGVSTWGLARRRKLISLVTFLGGSLILIGILIFFGENAALIGGAGLLVLLILVRLGFNFLDTLYRQMDQEAHRAERGAEAEEQVGQVLEGVGEDIFVLHDVKSPYGNIDHLAITREGRIFLLETKSHRGRVSVSGNQLLLNGHPMEKDPISQVLRNLFWLKDQFHRLVGIEPQIEGMVVFSRAFVPEPLTVRGVRVLNIRSLEQALRAGGRGNPEIWEARERIREAFRYPVELPPQERAELQEERLIFGLTGFQILVLLLLALLALGVYGLLGFILLKSYF